jgi:MFS family permease
VSKPLNREQKEAIGILSMGTFLEYFDLMLYVHMTVLLSELFFPKSDPHTTALLTSFVFCSTYIFRPIGALVFGYIGDNIGRKKTVIITTMLMATSCIIMANLPTYEKIGITASWILIICRITQGMSSMGEIIGADLYLIETIKPPAQYPAVALIESCFVLGGMFALAMASFVTSFGLDWRLAFWFGAMIAVVGIFARTRLRETPEFADAKRRISKMLQQSNVDQKELEDSYIYKKRANKKTLLALFLMDCAWPICFYMSYIYCGNILKDSFGFNAAQIIHHNLIVSVVELFNALLVTYLSYKIYPLKILKTKLVIFIPFALVCPYLLGIIGTSFEILLIQSFIMSFGCFMSPAFPIFYRHLPVFKRFTYATLSFALSRALIYTIISFGLVYLTEYLDHWGLLIVMIPIIIGYAFGLFHFTKLEKEAGNYPQGKISITFEPIQNPAR